MSKGKYCPKILVFEDGTKDNGGIILERLINTFHGYDKTYFNGEIVGVVSTHLCGGTNKKADKLEIPFYHFSDPGWTTREYKEIAKESGAEFFIFADWLHPVRGLDLETFFNSQTAIMVHPGPYPQFGGMGFYGRDISDHVIKSCKRGEISCSEVVCHFITDEFSKDTIFAKIRVEVTKDDTALILTKKVKDIISERLPALVNMVVNKQIAWDGVNPSSMVYQF